MLARFPIFRQEFCLKSRATFPLSPTCAKSPSRLPPGAIASSSPCLRASTHSSCNTFSRMQILPAAHSSCCTLCLRPFFLLHTLIAAQFACYRFCLLHILSCCTFFLFQILSCCSFYRLHICLASNFEAAYYS